MRGVKWSRGLLLSLSILMTSCMDMDITQSVNIQQIELKELKVGTKIELIAEPKPGFKFSHWSIGGEIVGKEETYVLIMPEENVSLQANFIRD